MRRLATLLIGALLGLGAGDALAARGNGPTGTKGAGRMPAAAKRMKTKMAQRAQGANTERPRSKTRRTQRELSRAMSRRDPGLGGSETERTRERVARGIGDGDGRPKATLKRSLKVALGKRGNDR